MAVPTATPSISNVTRAGVHVAVVPLPAMLFSATADPATTELAAGAVTLIAG